MLLFINPIQSEPNRPIEDKSANADVKVQSTIIFVDKCMLQIFKVQSTVIFFY